MIFYKADTQRSSELSSDMDESSSSPPTMISCDVFVPCSKIKRIKRIAGAEIKVGIHYSHYNLIHGCSSTPPGAQGLCRRR